MRYILVVLHHHIITSHHRHTALLQEAEKLRHAQRDALHREILQERDHKRISQQKDKEVAELRERLVDLQRREADFVLAVKVHTPIITILPPSPQPKFISNTSSTPYLATHLRYTVATGGAFFCKDIFHYLEKIGNILEIWVLSYPLIIR